MPKATDLYLSFNQVNVANSAVKSWGVNVGVYVVHGSAFLQSLPLSIIYFIEGLSLDVVYHLIAYLAIQGAQGSTRGITSAAFAPYPHGCP